MKKIIYSLIFVFALTTFVACERDPIDRNNSIFPEDTGRPKTEFDWWLHRNFVESYNVRIIYRFEDIESDVRRNLIPVGLRNSEVMAQIIQHVWFDAYTEVVNQTFIRTLAPRIINMLGSWGYNTDGTMVLGTAEGGLKVTLYGVNSVDEHNIDIEHLNRFFFHTMHHEFAHILHQVVMFPLEFATLSQGEYIAGNWIHIARLRPPQPPPPGPQTQTPGYDHANRRGFISPYAMSNRYEDFVELFSYFITRTPEWWTERMRIASFEYVRNLVPVLDAEGNILLDNEGNPVLVLGPWVREFREGAIILNRKLDILSEYMLTVWGLCIRKMRDVTLRRSAEVATMVFETFDNTPRMSPTATVQPFPVQLPEMRTCSRLRSNQ